MEITEGLNTFYAQTRTQWRLWLSQNHQTAKYIWLIIYHKNSGTESVYYDDAVEEALCFGWVDSKPNKRDQHSYYLFFAQRKPKSNWSRANRERAQRMIEQNLMTPAGQQMIDMAKAQGNWTALVNVQQLVIPDDLLQLLSQNPLAHKNFEAFAPSSKRIILEWILNAKRPETRYKRIAETVELAAQNIKANHYRQ